MRGSFVGGKGSEVPSAEPPPPLVVLTLTEPTCGLDMAIRIPSIRDIKNTLQTSEATDSLVVRDIRRNKRGRRRL